MDWNQIVRAKPLVAEGLRKDLGAFCRAAWPHLHRGSKLSWTPGHDLICEYLVMVWEGRTKRLIINCPPRFAKSSIATILFPIWVWLQNPTIAFLCCSYEIDLSVNHNQDRRRLMETKWFKDLFAESIRLATDRSQAGEFSNTAGGAMLAASSNSRAMGRGGDVVILDDLLSGDNAYSDVLRSEVNSWLQFMMPQRLNNPANSAIILIQQRLHQNDPTGFLLAQENSEWVLLKLALVAEQDEVWTFPISGRIWTRKKGECLDPKRWSPKVVRDRQQNRLVWSGQFQQSPMDPAGNLIRTDDIMYFGGRDPKTGTLDPVAPGTYDMKIISVDCTFKDRPANDFVTVIVIGVKGSRRWILHITRAHLDLTGTENEIRHCHTAHAPISAVLIEDKANGPAVVSRLTDQIPGVIAVNPEGGKMVRVVATSPEFQARNWYIERHGPWTTKFVEEATMFPNCRTDDILDSVTQASIWLQENAHDEEPPLVKVFKEIKAFGGLDRWFASRNRAKGEADPAITAIKFSCSHCGSTETESLGTGPSTRLHCLRCGKYSEGQLWTYPCPKCGNRTNAIGLREWRCVQCGFQFWPDGPPEIPRARRGAPSGGRGPFGGGG